MDRSTAGRPAQAGASAVALASSALCLAVLTACAGKPVDPGIAQDAQGCLAGAPKATGGSDYTARLNSLRARAALFSGCMQQHGYALDDAKLQDEMTHFEQVRNADPLGGDPRPAAKLHEQELICDPAYWRRSTPQS